MNVKTAIKAGPEMIIDNWAPSDPTKENRMNVKTAIKAGPEMVIKPGA